MEVTREQSEAESTTMREHYAEVEWRDGKSYGDLMDALSTAVTAKFNKKGDKGDDSWIYVQDFDDDSVIFSQDGEKFSVPYTLDGNNIDIGKAVTVKAVTTYVPIETKSAEPDKIPAVPKKHWSLREIEPPQVADFQVRGGDENTVEATLVGYASTTGNAYACRDWMGEYNETIMPGAFAKTLKESEYVPYLVDHKGDVLASWHPDSGRTLDMAEDGRGLRSEARLDILENSSSRNLVSGVRRGDYSKMSFSFRATKDDWNEAYSDRSVLELQLFDNAVVKSPANRMTSVGIRSSMLDIIGREGQATFRSAGEMYTEYVNTRQLGQEGEPIFEDSIRALKYMDERMVAQPQFMYCSRARTFAVVNAIESIRAGKTISSANEQLLKDALDALGQGANGLKTAGVGVAEAETAIRATLGDTEDNNGGKASNKSGLDAGKLHDGNPVSPADGAGVRSVPAYVNVARAQVELYKLNARSRKPSNKGK
jgi:hypothetical protein